VTRATLAEFNFDGLVGPTHNYAGLALGNTASLEHGGQVSSPKQAALQGLDKMWRLVELGVPQAVLPPQPRPDVATLRRFGFRGSDSSVIAHAARRAPTLLARCSSASSMWTANAATIAPSPDTEDGRLHLVVANLASMFHRQLEAPTTLRVLSRIFSDETHFAVHAPLPSSAVYGDEGAANHTRFEANGAGVHLFAWGHDPDTRGLAPQVHPARQSREASRAVAELLHLPEERALFWQQHPDGIDAGSFHSDVLAVGSRDFLMLHELAFVNTPELLATLRQRLGPGFSYELAASSELPVQDAVKSYPFNSQLVTLPDGALCIVAPTETENNPAARRFLERVVSGDNPVSRIEYLDVRQSMSNGGGPACLRLRVAMTSAQQGALGARVALDRPVYDALSSWIETHYRDALSPSDLADPAL
jgi:succinylarginine dihydrolase